MLRSLGPLIVVAALSAALTLAAALLVLSPVGGAAPDAQGVVPLVRTERIELVDAVGTVRARLSIDGESAALVLLGGGVENQASLSASANGAEVAVRSAGGLVGVEGRAQPDGTAWWTVQNRQGTGSEEVEARIDPSRQETRLRMDTAQIARPWRENPHLLLLGLQGSALLATDGLAIGSWDGHNVNVAPDGIVLREGGERDDPASGRRLWQAPADSR